VLFQLPMIDRDITCSMSRSASWENEAMEIFFHSPSTDRMAQKTYLLRRVATPDVFDYFERFYGPD
jgi:hypothetical protein